MSEAATAEKLAACHCGSVTLSLAAWPGEVTQCNCSLCRSYGAIWAYFPAKDVLRLPDPSLTDTYAWNGRHVDFHRCRNCGCVTHWLPRDKRRDRRGINARLLPVEVLAAARLRHRDGAGAGKLHFPSSAFDKVQESAKRGRNQAAAGIIEERP